MQRQDRFEGCDKNKDLLNHHCLLMIPAVGSPMATVGQPTAPVRSPTAAAVGLDTF